MKVTCMIFVLALMSCSTLTKNTFSNTTFLIQGIQVANVQDEQASLLFKRYSWYSELNMQLDFLIAKVDSHSPYRNWITATEKPLVASCANLYFAVLYKGEKSQMSEGAIEMQLKMQGLERVHLLQFKNEIFSHPDFDFSSRHYRVMALCSTTSMRQIMIDVPGFESKTLLL